MPSKIGFCDHQGSVRAVRAVRDESFNVKQSVSYTLSGVPVLGVVSSIGGRHRHTGKPWHNLGGLAWYDNRARWYDPVTMRFLAPDPLADQDPENSPWAWCRNNPMRYADPTGMWIVGTDGEDVSYNYATSQWSSNTPDDVKIIGNAMMQTKIGSEQLSKMLSIDIGQMVLVLDEQSSQIELESSGDLFGKAEQSITIEQDGTKRLTGGRMTIFKNVLLSKGNDDSSFYGLEFSLTEMISAVASHEAEHLLNPDAVSDFVGEEMAERIAREVEERAIRELRELKSS